MNNEQSTILLGIVGIKNMGDYDAETAYEKLNVVTYQGSTYCALKDTTGNLPTNTEYWQLYAEKGEQGIQGPQGVPGVQGPRGYTGNPGASPIAVDDTSNMTDTTKIYVLTTDGHWYWYDTDNTTWQDGGEYQATGISNGSITGIKTNFLNDSVNVLKIDDKSETTNGITYSISNGIITLNGTATDTFYIDSPILSKTLNGVYRFLAYAESPNDGIKLYVTTDTSVVNKVIELKKIAESQLSFINNLEFIKFRIRITSGTVIDNVVLKPMVIKEDYYYENMPYISYDEKLNTNHIYKIGKKVIDVENTNFIEKSYNLVNPDELIDGFVRGNDIYGFPYINESTSYKNITITNDSSISKTYYVYPSFRMYLISSPTADTDSLLPTATLNNTQSDTPGFVTVPAYSRLTVTFFSNVENPMIAESNVALDYIPFRYTIPHLYYDVDLSNLNNQIENLNNETEQLKKGNILYGKKLVTCGDSFTEYTNATFDSGIYQGKNKVWPYLIGLRNNMTVNNMAVSGSTMAVNSDTTHMHFAESRYTEIPNDADYIIIKYGINDLNMNNPIGTIDSTDDTTFYGAWNKVIPYIIEHHPTAKIGIIVTNGLSLQVSQPNNSYYANAIIEIAKKYGIPTLNEWNDPNVPLLLRTGRSDVDSSIRTIRHNTFRISQDNTHENYICHEYESTFIEDFLRRL